MQTSTIILVFLFLLASCGGPKGGGGGTSSKKKEPVQIDLDASIEGQYLAVFETLNPQITSKVTGAFTFSRDILEDELVMDVRLNNGGPKIIHSQSVRLGGRCPTMADDTNGDGIIDAKEGEAVYGKIFIPLDGDIGSQSSHDGEFPVGDTYGNYIYARVTKFTKFITDLRSDEDSDLYVKLKAREALRIEKRTVVVHGVDEASDLPYTVASIGRGAAHQTLPIACGVIHKIINPPGTIEENL